MLYFLIFAGLSKLFSLHLQHNAPSDVFGGMWEGLDTLQYLILDDNMIHTLEQFAPTQLPNLHELQLSGNGLQNISTGEETLIVLIFTKCIMVGLSQSP